MLRNKRFKLTKPALALDAVVRQGWITIPAGETIRVLAGPHGEGEEMIDILWDGRMLTMFAIDVTAGCDEVNATEATPVSPSEALDAFNRQPHDPARKQG